MLPLMEVKKVNGVQVGALAVASSAQPILGNRLDLRDLPSAPRPSSAGPGR